MIYDYYCTNCGHKFSGKEVVFDLVQILDFHSGKSGNLFIKFTPEDLRELAERNGAVLADGKRIRLKLSLFDLLGYMAQDLPNTVDQEAMQELTYEEFEQVTAMSNLLISSSGLQNMDVKVENVRALVDSIIAKLEQEEKTDPNISEEEWNQNTENYSLFFWVEPVYFEGTEDIYSIRYSCEKNPANLLPFIFSGLEIRGYCPECTQPVLRGSGEYEHILVGFLGAQSAGKTSLFVSMINDSKNYFGKMGIEYPELLCDGKYEKIKNAIEFNANGWAVGKTDAKATIEAYNASLLITRANDQRKVILSFIDIAGELCYDQETKGISLDALKKFPLITACHLYMLCTCVSQRGYGEEDEDTAKINNTALMNIATGIYRQRVNNDDKLTVPPMAIVITKIDMAVQNTQIERGSVEQNPFAWDKNNLSEMRYHQYEKKDAFNLPEQIEHLKGIYAETSNIDIREALRWCRTTYEDKKKTTYISFIPCSALGKKGRKYNPEKDDFYKDGDTFTPLKLDVVWTWILCNIGIKTVFDDYCLPFIPSYGEGIKLKNMPQGSCSVRCLFQEKEEENRTKAVCKLYLNLSDFDRELYNHHKGNILPPSWPNPFILHTIEMHEKKRIELIKRYLESHSN
ncbi:MAG: hypothetical protein MRZ69_08310 [Lachnospiraceae bacterium]|nr:hypothetical protein [Lachnospiraceae bacterium]